MLSSTRRMLTGAAAEGFMKGTIRRDPVKVTESKPDCQTICNPLKRDEIEFLTSGERSLKLPVRTTRPYSTSRGAVYPAFARIVYLISLPFSSLIGSGSFVAGFTNSTLIFRNLPSFDALLGE